MNLRVDTLNKKPKVYSLAALGLLVLAALGLLFAYGGEGEIPLSCLLLAFGFAAAAVLLVRAFFLQIRYNPYSYNTIIYFGFALFTVSLTLTCTVLHFKLRGMLPEFYLLNLLAAVYLYFECMLLGTMAANAIAARFEPEKNKDYLIVLGCAVRRDGSPTPLLRSRLDRALDFARAQEAVGGKPPCFLLSGGKGADEPISEAECMRRYLAEKGIPAERMLLEDASTDTAENMRFSKALIPAGDPAPKTAFSTANYHVFRAGIKARQVKLRAQGMGSRTRWYFWPNAAVREFVGLITQHRGKQAGILLGLAAAYTVLTLVFYTIV